MPTALTHALVGASLAPLANTGVSRPRLAAVLALAAMLPDLDVVGFSFGVPYSHPLGHRGLSHSIPFALAFGSLAAACLLPTAPFDARKWRLAGIVALATVSHGVLDAFTDGGKGIGFFLPFHRERFFFPWRPLATSPIGIEAFLRGRMSDVLANEIRFVWLPLALVWAAASWRFLRRRMAS